MIKIPLCDWCPVGFLEITLNANSFLSPFSWCVGLHWVSHKVCAWRMWGDRLCECVKLHTCSLSSQHIVTSLCAPEWVQLFATVRYSSCMNLWILGHSELIVDSPWPMRGGNEIRRRVLPTIRVNPSVWSWRELWTVRVWTERKREEWLVRWDWRSDQCFLY